MDIRLRPILMSGDMVVETLADRKTNTRRTKGLEKFNKSPDEWNYRGTDHRFQDTKTQTPVILHVFRHKVTERIIGIKCPYGETGDRLWVRETWAAERQFDHLSPNKIPQTAQDKKRCFYLEHGLDCSWYKKRPSIFMPRWASRILLDRTFTRLERVQDISEEDAKAEGVTPLNLVENWPNNVIKTRISTYKESFIDLWFKLNFKRGYGWDKNPWVWVIGYKRITNGEAKKEMQKAQ